MKLLISIHDVTPALADGVRRLWDLCDRHDVCPALLVVPQWHGEWALEDHPRMVEWLRACAAAGAEIVLHGERHDEVGLPRGWRDQVRAWGRTNREGEFLTLGAAGASERIGRGLARLRALGLDPTGFVPPAWLARREGFAAVAGAGLHFTEDSTTIRLSSGQRIASPVIRWSARTGFRARGSVAIADMRWRMQRREPIVRIAYHPPDLEHPATARSAAATLARWLAERPAARYADLWADPVAA